MSLRRVVDEEETTESLTNFSLDVTYTRKFSKNDLDYIKEKQREAHILDLVHVHGYHEHSQPAHKKSKDRLKEPLKIINQKLTDFYNDYYKDRPNELSKHFIERNIKNVCNDVSDELIEPLLIQDDIAYDLNNVFLTQIDQGRDEGEMTLKEKIAYLT